MAAKHATRDSTKYTRCARSFRQYHGQRISHAIVMTDALNIYDGILKLKKTHGSAAPRGLDARHRLVGPRPHGALTVCESLGLCGVCLTPHAKPGAPQERHAQLRKPGAPQERHAQLRVRSASSAA
jgi:hypothetical protein